MTKKYKVYYSSNGQLQYGEQKVNGKWYYFSKKTAYMTTGLQTVGKSKKYYASNGQRKTGYQKIMGKGYYFDKKSGAMFIKKFAFVGGRDYYALSNGVLHAPTWHSQFTTIYAPEGCAVASSATLLSIKSRSFNMRYAYNNLPQYGGVYSTANFRGLLSVSSLTNYMKKFDGGFTNITGSSMAEIQSVVKSGPRFSTMDSLATKLTSVISLMLRLLLVIRMAASWFTTHATTVLAVVPATETPTPTALLPGLQFQPWLENQLVVQTTVQSW